MNIKKQFGIFLLSLCAIGFTNCSNDDTENDPVDTVTLNMLNEQNGKTFLGKANVYINKANNFFTVSDFISDVGNISSIGTKIDPQLKSLTQEVAVVPGHGYQIFDKNTVQDFPSGNRAIQVEASYYQTYVISKISKSGITTGAIVKYISVYPDKKGLPPFEHTMGNLKHLGESIELALPRNSEYFFVEHHGSGEKGAFNISTTNNKLVITLAKEPDIEHGPYGTYDIYIRSENVFTVVKVNVR